MELEGAKPVMPFGLPISFFLPTPLRDLEIPSPSIPHHLSPHCMKCPFPAGGGGGEGPELATGRMVDVATEMPELGQRLLLLTHIAE